MIWVWLYLGGAALWVFAVALVSGAVEEKAGERAASIFAGVVLAPVWPLGAVIFLGSMIGSWLRSKS